MHVICNKAKRICKHLIADAGEEDPEKISCSKWKMSCMVLIAANLRHVKITDNLFSVLCFFFVLLTKGRIVILSHILIFLLAILIPTSPSSSMAFCMMYSVYKLNKQSDNIHP